MGSLDLFSSTGSGFVALAPGPSMTSFLSTPRRLIRSGNSRVRRKACPGSAARGARRTAHRCGLHHAAPVPSTGCLEGIAQFMPERAAERGLADPRDPHFAIPHAARLLADLRCQFGNLGLAAAAYNAGPGRVSEWLRGSGMRPAETRASVQLVTGQPVERWRGLGQVSSQEPTKQSCAGTVSVLIRTGNRLKRSAEARQPPPIAVSADGKFVTRNTADSLSVSERLAIHHLLNRAIGLKSRP